MTDARSRVPQPAVPPPPADAEGSAWYAVWTRSHCERLVRDQLAGEGFDTFLPEVAVWVRENGQRRAAPLPLFPGYLFLHHAMDKASYLRAIRARGIVSILGQSWDRLEVVPDHEIDAVRRILGTSSNPIPYPYVREGERVEIRQGPFAGVSGILLRIDAARGLLVVSIELFRRSLAVEVDCTMTSPIGGRGAVA
jgi:transcription antitermination factor NusG